ncbi:hypothetical protein SYNPS1DRAFT_31463 [Syncephalis pseudoplumigaleata]|uniref:Armadillo-type protein n=1 Tax=Syncephalis pseudoplumigaleata TaxID=1712513 RepID=A0A4P9YSE8_9FUNG|nr:hypothetical protein SYNPS1DRAFT_31463 [Syncephalis pseudoplumigaleata]|eukprot:RKP22863.1 hypothetical protein SYNPS1DRAFT_31463 [Syncephalis pseudoplumigaleata]
MVAAVPAEQRKRKQPSKQTAMQSASRTNKAATRPTKTPHARKNTAKVAAATTTTSTSKKTKERGDKRAMPVTKARPVVEDDTDDEDVEMAGQHGADSSADEYEMEVDQMEEGDDDNGLVSDVDADATPAEAKRAKTGNGESQRMSSSQKRELLRERRAGKPNQDRIWELKKLWEKLRPQGVSKKEQTELVAKILAIINGDYAEVGSYYCRASCYSDCMADGPRMRDPIIKEFQGHLGQLLFRQEAATVLEEIFSRHSTAQQRSSMLVEFYGPEYRLFKVSSRQADKRTDELCVG